MYSIINVRATEDTRLSSYVFSRIEISWKIGRNDKKQGHDLSGKGKRYLNEIGLGYRNINRDETYKKRMERISDIACKVKSCGWYFEPSWKCDVNTYTKRGNRYVGIMSREEKQCNEEFMRNKVKETF